MQVGNKVQNFLHILVFDGSAWNEHHELELSEEMVPQLSARARNVLFGGLKVKTFGELFALDVETVLGAKNAGVKTVREILSLRNAIFNAGPGDWVRGNAVVEEDEVALPLLTVPADTLIPMHLLQGLSTRSRNALLSLSPHPTVGMLCRLDYKTVKAMRGAGNLVASELMSLRGKYVASEASDTTATEEPSAADFGSLSEMLLVLEGTGLERSRQVLALAMGLLNVHERQTLEECGRVLGVTRERVRQIAVKIEKRLFYFPRRKALYEIEMLVREMFEANNREVVPETLVVKVESAFGWTGTTVFSFRCLLEYLGWKIEDLHDDRGWGWNEDGRFDWVKTYVPPTLTERRRVAIKKVLTDAGYTGLTLDEIYTACLRDYPELEIAKGNIRSAMNFSLDGENTRIIPYDRGTRQNAGTRYSLNVFFHDERTRAVLERAATQIREYMEKTGLGVVSVWKASQAYQSELPCPLPKLGFYMMMRDFKSGGLVYQDYPRIAYPGIKLGENTFPWMLYMYCMICRRPKASFAEIMYFFTECLGLQPSIALSCAFNSMGLKKAEDDQLAPFVVKPPVEGETPPSLFLPGIRNYLDFSLIKLPEKGVHYPCFLDEDGHALTYPTYAKLFFLALVEKKFDFPATELAGLQDRGWCKVNFKACHPVLLKAGSQTRPTVSGYWRGRFRFNGDDYFVSDDWEARNKSMFDRWAARIASLAGITFEPYDIKGMGT